MRKIWTCVIAAATLSGCAQPGSPSPGKPSSAAAADATAPGKPESCHFQALGRTLRPGEDLQFVFTVKPDSQWCFDGFRVSGSSTEGETVTDPPAHGTLRLVRREGAVVLGYRPDPGYSGSDRFRVSIPADFGTTYFAGHVTVEQ